MAPVLFGSYVSAVNFSEVVKKSLEKNAATEKILRFLAGQALQVLPFDQQRAVNAASLFPLTSASGLSFADRACMALGLELRLPVLTAETRMSTTVLDIDVLLIRTRQVH